MGKNEIKQQIFEIIENNWEILFPQDSFKKGQDYIQYSGAVFDHKEMEAAVNVLLDGWFGIAKKALLFEKKISDYIGVSDSVVVNSGSSANLLAVSSLKSRKLDQPLSDGDEVITAATGFPTTINPIIQNNLIPVFIDVDLGSYNIDLNQVKKAISKKTKGIIFAHTLGNPVDMKIVNELAQKYNLYVIEDCCDALGSEIYGKKVGSFGDISTLSYYPAHHITMGEGGSISTSNKTLLTILRSLREWGRDCHCYGKETVDLINGTCGKRFSKWLPGLDVVFDHKYVYSEIGYNLKPLELQCAIGLEQMKKLPDFHNRRVANFKRIYKIFKEYEEYFILPSWLSDSNPSWFGFPVTIKENCPFNRFDIIHYLEKNKIQTRNLFAGNITRQPAYKDIKFRQIGNLINSDIVCTNTFFLGVYPGIDDNKIDYMSEKIQSFFKRY